MLWLWTKLFLSVCKNDLRAYDNIRKMFWNMDNLVNNQLCNYPFPVAIFQMLSYVFNSEVTCNRFKETRSTTHWLKNKTPN